MTVFQCILLLNLAVLLLFSIIGFIKMRIKGINFWGRRKKADNITGRLTLCISILLLLIFWVWYIVNDNVSYMFVSIKVLNNSILIKWIGTVIVCLGTILEIIAAINLGDSARFHSPLEETKLITSGIYGICRNPVVIGCFFWAFGIFLLNINLLGLLMFITVLIGLNFKVDREAEDLKKRFGKEWDDYCRKTGKYFPKNFFTIKL